MKIIGLMPVRNEAWILPFTLKALSQICDVIVVADQASEDDTKRVCEQFSRVKVIENNEIGHSNKVRWTLLDAARDFDGENLLLSVDADEFLPPSLFSAQITQLRESLRAGKGLQVLWVQLWKSLEYWRDDHSVWSNNWKTIGFRDDRTQDYDRNDVVINDHTSRVPVEANRDALRMEGVPLVHLQWAVWDRAQLKQAWYRCTELVRGIDAVAINEKYAITLDDPTAGLSKVPASWFEGQAIEALQAQMTAQEDWRLREILQWFDQRGVEFFEPLQIWHILELKAEFIKRTGKLPAKLSTAQETGYLARLAARIRRLAT